MDAADDTTITELDSIADWVAAYRKAKELEKIAAEKAAEARAVLTAKLDETGAEFGTVDDVPVLRWRSVESNRLDTKKLRAEHPELCEQFSKLSVAMRLEIL